MLKLVAVFVGGGLGSLCRYGLSLGLPASSFPWGTLVANVLACGLLGMVLGASEGDKVPQEWRLLLGTGFCGGFSTFSTFIGESHDLPKTVGAWLTVVYMALSLVLGWTALVAGWWSIRQSRS